MNWGGLRVVVAGGVEVRKLSETNKKYTVSTLNYKEKMSFHYRGDQERISPVNSAS